MKTTYSYEDVSNNQGMVEFITEQNVINNHQIENSLKGFNFKEFELEELNFPSATDLLNATLKIKEEIGLSGWKNNGIESNIYKGFSLTYNPDFYDKSVSIYHQTLGSPLLTQNFGKIKGLGNHSFIKNTYYDTFSFRKRLPSVEKHLGKFLDCFNFPVFRSRAAFFNSFLLRPDNNKGWHVDEPATHLTRINIPLQTSPEHVLEIKGQDEFGNSLEIVKHLKVGKAYIWNTRIPHRVTVNSISLNRNDRIHLVIGFSPWIDYDPINDLFFKSDAFGMTINEIIEKKLFIKNENSCNKK